MKHIYATLIACFLTSFAFGQTRVDGIKIEHRVNPLGIDTSNPRFSWMLQSEKRKVTQTAYEIQVASSEQELNGSKLVWTSGKINSDQSVNVAYSGKPLESGVKYFWRVRIWDHSHKKSDWSKTGYWQMGMLKPIVWKAKWITHGFVEDSVLRPSPYFRKTFSASKKIKSATAFIASLGLYEAYINGKRIGDSYLTPGWTSYNKRLQYQQYDVTSMLSTNNAIGVVMGSGWYRGFIAFEGQKNFYGKQLALLLQIEVAYEDGSREVIVSDDSWKSATGEITSSEIYHGETIDRSRLQVNWNTHGFDDSKWSSVKIVDRGYDKLIATYNEPIRKHERFKAIQHIVTPKGEQVLDFGQNLVGWVEVILNGKRGDRVTISHAEVLDKAGNFYTENLRPAKQQNTYILRGDGEEFFEPHFTFQGFRYIRIEGHNGPIDPSNFTAVALYSDMPLTGKFESSNRLVNQLQHNIQWGQRGNFLDVPTDCPQRDERLGWTGDAQAFSRTAAFNFGVYNFFSKWLKDLAVDQENGNVPFVVPDVVKFGGQFSGGSAGWADAATIIPWNMYLAYGDKQILVDQYESMKQWVEWIERKSKDDLWNTGFHFGDWLFYRPFDDNDGRSAVTDKYLIAQCFWAHSTQLLINAANVLGKQEDIQMYSARLAKIKDAFNREYVTGSGRLVSGTQTAYVLALNFDMLPESQRAKAAEHLVANVRNYGNHLSTGFLGTPYLCHVLSRFGYDDVAYTLLEQETYPSWLYPVKMGATTIWERWDGIKPDSTFQTPGMNSFNHYAYGAIGDWMYRVMVGIDTKTEAPGYKHIIIHPRLGGSFTHASAELMTVYGWVKSSWRKQGEKLVFDVTIPANTKATIYLPGPASTIKLDQRPLASTSDLKVGSVNNNTVVDVGSGVYSFEVD